jgi:ABC-type multidrug transport system fused ATPase/permease subunit
VAIVGRSGAGKSTLISLLPRFYDVWEGSVRVDGRDVRDLTLRSLRDQIGTVQQESILFSGTIRENILYGRNNATERGDDSRRRAWPTWTSSWSPCPIGYETVIGERGVSLSGRAEAAAQHRPGLPARPADPHPRRGDVEPRFRSSEQVIQEALRELMQGRTTLVIAHRLSTVDGLRLRALVVEEGRIVQQGPARGADPT